MGPIGPTKVFMALAWILGWILFTRAPRISKRRGEDTSAADLGPITVVIPARNEASSLPNLLASLAAQRPPQARIIVVNDGSEDNTADLARSFDFVEVIDADPLRDGWIGKTWACHTGAALGEPGTLVFIDADVHLHGDALERAVRMQQEKGGLLTVWPRHIVKRPYEYFSALFNVCTMMGVGAGSLIRPRTVRGGFGPLMIASTETYSAVGGHEAIKSCVIDDFALAGAYTDAGLPVTNLAGGEDVSFRMYPDGFATLVEGWTKNTSSGAFTVSLWRFGGIVAWMAFALGSMTWGGGLPRDYSVLMCSLFALQMFVMMRQLGNFGLLTALLYPLHILMVLLVLIRSIHFSVFRRSVVWRGRQISTDR
jgi:4,4'-diaponeurosporenoate glycosyltransferase